MHEWQQLDENKGPLKVDDLVPLRTKFELKLEV